MWASGEIAAATGGRVTAPFVATGVSIDTRTLRAGEMFVALEGERDGHAFIPEALARGAAGVLARRDVAAPAVIVDDTLAGLTALGTAGRARFGGRVVAITGSVGKTTTKEMLRAALGAFGRVSAAPASYNNQWGVPLTFALCPPDADFLVVEVGMNHPGEILPLARLARPDVAVITAIAAAHIGHMGSLEAIADEKASILEALGPEGVSVLPAEAPHIERLRAHAPSRVLMFEPSDWPAAVTLRAPGVHMRSNAAAALAACAALGLDRARAQAPIAGFEPVRGRGQQRVLGPIRLLDESYNANGASVRAALEVLRGMAGTRRVAVLGDMLELGAFGPAEHAGLAADVEASADVLYACGPLMRHLFDAVSPGRRGRHAADSAAMAPIVAEAVRAGDAVLVKGSLGSRMSLAVAALEARFAEPVA